MENNDDDLYYSDDDEIALRNKKSEKPKTQWSHKQTVSGTSKNPNFFSIECVANVLDSLDSLDCSATNSVEREPENINYPSRHSALYKYFGQLVHSIWEVKCVTMPQSESAVSHSDCAEILNGLHTLKVFIDSTEVSNVSGFDASTPDSLRKLLAHAVDEENRCIEALSLFIDRTCEVLTLWQILCERPVHALFTALIQDEQDILAACTFRDLIASRVDGCALVIKLVNSCLKNDTAESLISPKMYEICPISCRHVLHEVMEILRSTQMCCDYGEREEKVSMALQLFNDVAAHVQLDADFLAELLKISNRSAGEFLVRSVLHAPDDVNLIGILWKYYECNGRQSAATKILDELVSLPNDNLTLTDHIDDLERAVNNDRSLGNGIPLKSIEETLEIAHVQKIILDTLSTVPSHDAQLACLNLNQRFYTINQLYGDFVVRFDLTECKSEILQYKTLQTICIDEKELVDLNDDCLLAIFERLPHWDLASVADVSRRFRAIAQESFRLTKPVVGIPWNLRDGRLRYNKDDGSMSKKSIARKAFSTLRNFGASITDLSIDNICSMKIPEKEIVRLIIEHCGRSLSALELRLKETESIPIEMRPIIENLKKLRHYSIRVDPSYFSWLSEIEDLEIKMDSRCDAKPLDHLFKQTFHKLQRFSLNVMKLEWTDYAMFLQKHKTLKEIILECELDGERPYNLFGNEWLPIEKFHSKVGSNIRASGFRNLKNLQSLALGPTQTKRMVSDEVEAIFREISGAEIPLKHLTLEHILLLDGVCDALSQLVYLETLHLFEPNFRSVETIMRLSPQLIRLNELEICFRRSENILISGEIETLVKGFPNLHHLKLRFNDSWVETRRTLNVLSFENIVAIVSDRPNKKPLHINLSRDCYINEVPEELAQRHRHILTINCAYF